MHVLFDLLSTISSVGFEIIKKLCSGVLAVEPQVDSPRRPPAYLLGHEVEIGRLYGLLFSLVESLVIPVDKGGAVIVGEANSHGKQDPHVIALLDKV